MSRSRDDDPAWCRGARPPSTGREHASASCRSYRLPFGDLAVVRRTGDHRELLLEGTELGNVSAPHALTITCCDGALPLRHALAQLPDLRLEDS